MRILITGGAGYLGQIVAKALLDDPANELLLADIVEPPVPRGARHPGNAATVQADLADDADAARVVGQLQDLDAAILFHGVMSSAAEADLALGYRVNVDATRVLLFRLAQARPGVRVLYTSSTAVYGRPVPQKGVTERDAATPELSYGCQKVIGEALVNDLTRRGLINGFALRLPTISVRPGKPSAALSAFLSGIVREPMNGQECVVPLRDRAWRHWMCSPKTLVHNVLVALALPADSLPPHRRSVNVPGFAVSVQDMLDALAEVAGADKLALVREEDVESVKAVLYSWADDFDNSLGLSLGMRQDHSFVQSVLDYKETLEQERAEASEASNGAPSAANGHVNGHAKTNGASGVVNGAAAVHGQ